MFFSRIQKNKKHFFFRIVLLDKDENIRPFKIDRGFIRECLRINGRSIELLHKYDPSILVDKDLLKLAYQSVGPVLMRSLNVSYRKTVRNLLNKKINTTLKRQGTMTPKKRKKVR